MSLNEPFGKIAGIPLETHVDELRRRCEAIGRIQGGSTHYLEEVRIFRDYAREKSLFCPPSALAELSRPPDDAGNEHQVWFQTETNSYLKAAWPNFFGLLVLYRQDEDERASPIAYLERWQLHNELFGDSVRLVGVISESEGMRLVIQQPAIKGVPAALAQINEFFKAYGWQRFVVGREVAYFDPERHVAISDTHRGNLILMDDGLIAPIDLRVQHLSGATLDYVLKLTRQD